MMRKWKYHVKIRHLFTESDEPPDIQTAMRAIADVLDISPCFKEFSTYIEKFCNILGIPAAVDQANDLLALMYDYADDHRIWIE